MAFPVSLAQASSLLTPPSKLHKRLTGRSTLLHLGKRCLPSGSPEVSDALGFVSVKDTGVRLRRGLSADLMSCSIAVRFRFLNIAQRIGAVFAIVYSVSRTVFAIVF